MWRDRHLPGRRCCSGGLHVVSGVFSGSESVNVHPPSLQLVMPRGVPLYPVLITRFSRTMQQPTRRFMQLLLRAARSANCIKYWSQLGRTRASSIRSKCSMALRRELMSDEVLSSFSCALWQRALRPVSGANKCSSLRRTKSSRVGGVC
jgi:hypothetical protein